MAKAKKKVARKTTKKSAGKPWRLGYGATAAGKIREQRKPTQYPRGYFAGFYESKAEEKQAWREANTAERMRVKWSGRLVSLEKRLNARARQSMSFGERQKLAEYRDRIKVLQSRFANYLKESGQTDFGESTKFNKSVRNRRMFGSVEKYGGESLDYAAGFLKRKSATRQGKKKAIKRSSKAASK